MRSVRRVVGGVGERISEREETGQSQKRVQRRTLSSKHPCAKLLQWGRKKLKFPGAPSHKQTRILRRMDSHTNSWHPQRDAEFNTRTEPLMRETQTLSRQTYFSVITKPLNCACVRQTAVKPATLAFRIATLHSFIPTHKHTSLLLLPVGLTIEPFPGGVARDTRSFPGVPSPLG